MSLEIELRAEVNVEADVQVDVQNEVNVQVEQNVEPEVQVNVGLNADVVGEINGDLVNENRLEEPIIEAEQGGSTKLDKAKYSALWLRALYFILTILFFICFVSNYVIVCVFVVQRDSGGLDKDPYFEKQVFIMINMISIWLMLFAIFLIEYMKKRKETEPKKEAAKGLDEETPENGKKEISEQNLDNTDGNFEVTVNETQTVEVDLIAPNPEIMVEQPEVQVEVEIGGEVNVDA